MVSAIKLLKVVSVATMLLFCTCTAASNDNVVEDNKDRQISSTNSKFDSRGEATSSVSTNKRQIGYDAYNQYDDYGVRLSDRYGAPGLRSYGLGSTGYGVNGLRHSSIGLNDYDYNTLADRHFGLNRFGYGSNLRSNLLNSGYDGYGYGSTGLRSDLLSSGYDSNLRSGLYNSGYNSLRSNLNSGLYSGRYNSYLRNDLLNGGYSSSYLGSNLLGSRYGNYGLRNSLDGSASILNYRNHNLGNGLYSFGYETDNGIAREETRSPNGVEGSYSYTSPEGIPVTVRYRADENGFQVESPNVPETPLHSKLQILAAQEARQRGLVDDYGNVITDQGRFQTSNLRNLVLQNPHYSTYGSSRYDTGLRAGGYGYNSYNRGNLFSGATVVRDPLLDDVTNPAAYNRELLRVYGRDDLRGSLFLDDDRLYADQFATEGVRPTFDTLSQTFSRVGRPSSESIIDQLHQRLGLDSSQFSARDGRAREDLGGLDVDSRLLRPTFERLTAAAPFGLDGYMHRRTPFARVRDLDTEKRDLRGHIDEYHASKVSAGATNGETASHVHKS